MRLFHFSEDQGIERFVPRESRLGYDCVWTIDQAHAPLYYFPRDCPRAAFWRLSTTSEEDDVQWLGGTTARMVIAIEGAWLDRLRACRLWRYEFATNSFEPLHDHGVHVICEPISPLGPPEPVGDLLQKLAESEIELRITPSLWPLHRALVPTTLHWSFIRMRNAAPELQEAK